MVSLKLGTIGWTFNNVKLEEKTIDALNKSIKWFNNNKLTINLSKTKIINFNHNHNSDILINNNAIEFINNNNMTNNSFKFLGFTITEKLDFHQHKIKLIQKLNSCIYILRKIKHIFPTSTKLLIYHSLFGSHINYGLVAWSTNDKSLNRIYKLQKKAIRLVGGYKYNSHSEHIFKKLKILKIKDEVTLSRLLLAHSIKHKTGPCITSNLMIQTQQHQRLRRNLNNFIINNSNKNSLLNYIIPNNWNELEESKKLITSKKRFKNEIKKQLLNNYTANKKCGKRNCYICKWNPDSSA